MASIQHKDPRETQKKIEARKAAEERRAAAERKRRELWPAINHGGWLVSAPAERDLRVEVPHGSELPDRLFDLGYDPRPAGTNTRISGGLFVPVCVYTFQIPLR